MVIYTSRQIEAHALALDPERAIKYTDGNRLAFCRTQVYERVLVNGVPKELIRPKDEQGRECYGVGYVRVSTKNQKEDGFSITEQIRKVIAFFIAKGLAFCIVSDAGLGGGIPYDDDTIKSKMWANQARNYDIVFRRVFLDSSMCDMNDPKVVEDRKAMEKYLSDEVQKIQNGGYMEEIQEVGMGRDRRQALIRPGLTALLQALPNVHTIAITDLSRLTRDDFLTSDLLPRFEEHNVHVEGLYEPLEWITKRNDDDISATLIGAVMTIVATFKLREVILGSLRGILAMLESGKPFGKLPFWCIEEDGKEGNKRRGGPIVLDAEYAQVIQEMVAVYLDENREGTAGNEASYEATASELTRRGRTTKTGKTWTGYLVKDILNNPALIGYQVVFGKRWAVLPPVIPPQEWESLQKKINRRKDNFQRKPIKNVDGHLLRGLLKCWCGRIMCYHVKQNGTRQYICTAPTSVRMNKIRPHASFPAAELEAFFDVLMGQNYIRVVAQFRQASEGKKLQDELEKLEEEVARRTIAREVQTEERRLEAETKLRDQFGDEIPQDDPDYQAAVKGLVGLMTKQLRKEEVAEQNQVTRLRNHLNDIAHTSELAKAETVLKTWADLTNNRKNAALKTLFEGFQVDGEPPQERILARFRLEEQPLGIPPIYQYLRQT